MSGAAALHGQHAPTPAAGVPPQRIQLRRTRGWRKTEGAVVVARPSRWGNPFPTERWGRELAVQLFRDWLNGNLSAEFLACERVPAPPTAAEIRTGLAGRDLACWCPLVDEHESPVPCHADVLLELDNS